MKNQKGDVFLEIDRDKELKCISANWMGQVSEGNVKDGAMEVLNELRTTGYKKLLNNNKKLLGTWNVANEWITNVWIPKAVDLKIEKFAHVLSSYLFGQLSAEEMKVHVGTNFKMHLFKDIEKAKEWLRE